MPPFKLDMYDDSGSESEYIPGSDCESVDMDDCGPDGSDDAALSGALGSESECGPGSDFDDSAAENMMGSGQGWNSQSAACLDLGASPREAAEVGEADEVEAEIQRFETRLTDVNLGGGENGTKQMDDVDIEDDDGYDDDGYDEEDEDDATLFGGNRNPPEYYKRRMKSMDEAMYDRKEYSEGTERAIASAHEQWSRFCEQVLEEKDAMLAYRSITFRAVYNFLDWLLNQTRGKHQQRKKGIRSKNSLITSWCVFRLAFERARNIKIDEVIDRRRLSNALVELGTKHKLSTEKAPNESMTIEDLKLQLDTILRTTDKTFNLGEVRALAILYLLLLAPAGSRPRSILNVRFGDIQLLLVRDPNGGPHRLLIKLSLRHTKRYLGPKLTKTFFVPEIIYDPSLLLSPHVFLLGILFHNRAFHNDALNNRPSQLGTLDIHKLEAELPLPLKKELKDVFLFRRTTKDQYGYKMSNQPISQGMMSGWVKRIGELAGFEFPTKCYNLRYMAGNSMDRSVNVSDALRNLVMDHAPNSDTFQKHYLNRNVCMDIWAIARGGELQQGLVEKATSHGHSQSHRRPFALTPEQSAALSQHPSFIKLSAKLRHLPMRSDEYRQIKLELRALRQRLYIAKKKSLRAEFQRKQALEDIDNQLNGAGIADQARRSGQEQRPMGPAQQRLVTAVTAPLASIDITAQSQRRANAVTAIIAYCAVEERLLTPFDTKPPRPPPEIQQQRSGASKDTRPLPSQQLKASVFVQSPGQKLLRCFICIGKALALSPDDPEAHRLCRDFFNPSGITRHFRRIHLRNISDSDKTICPVCVPEVKLKNKMHLQHHADAVHGINTNTRDTY